MVELGTPPEEMTPEQRGIENAKATLLTIERFVFALSKVDMPLQYAKEAIAGVEFLQMLHANLLVQIGPEEVARLKAQHAAPNQPPAPKIIKPNEVA
jgi:hypothetical protein